MLSVIEKTLLTELLALAPSPEETFSYDELMGYFFGLAISPVQTPTEEWLPAIFGHSTTATFQDQMHGMQVSLEQIYAMFQGKKQQGELHFPFQIETLEDRELAELLGWVSGFEEALELHPECWEPEHHLGLTERKKEELFFSMMVVQGLVDPDEIMPFFDKMPEQVLAEMFFTIDSGAASKEHQAQAFLLATLPLAIQTLQEHARYLEHNQLDDSATTDQSRQQPPQRRKDTRKKNIIQVDFANREITSPAVRLQVPTYQLKVGLKGAKPPIWRRILVPGTTSLSELHEIIQLTMGWQDAHLHHFLIDQTIYGPVVLENEEAMPGGQDEERHTLFSLQDKIDPYFDYIYDFGDNWEHRIHIEKLHSPQQDRCCPVLLTGRRACPPEDVGGIQQYQDFLQIMTDSTHLEHEAIKNWIGPNFKPERFEAKEIKEINTTLQRLFSKEN